MLSKYVSDNIVQKNYLWAMLAQSAKTHFQIYRYMSGSLFLTGYYITEQSSLFLLNAGSGVHLGLAGLQQTGADFDWNNILKNFSDFSRMKLAQNIFVKLVHFV